jgi:putative endonuclease
MLPQQQRRRTPHAVVFQNLSTTSVSSVFLRAFCDYFISMHNIFDLPTKQFGKLGERIAGEYLKERDWKIAKTNWQNRFGEIDIVALAPPKSLNSNEKQLVFVEVKSRRTKNSGFPEEAINKKKFSKISKMIRVWTAENPRQSFTERIDAVAIFFPKDEKIEYENVEDLTYKNLKDRIVIRHLESVELGEFL